MTSIADRIRPNRSRMWLLPLTGAAAAVVLVAALTAGRADDGVRVVPADETTPTTQTDAAPAPIPPAPTSTTASPTSSTASQATTAPVAAAASTRTGRSTPDGAVVAWVQALGDGNIDAAVALVGPRTESYLKAIGANTKGMMTESQEGYGAWSITPDRTTTEVDLGVVSGVDSTVVVIAGTWKGEGEDGYRTDAVPVTKSGKGGTWLVEPNAFDPKSGGRLEVISPSSADSGLNGLAADAKIEARSAGDGAFWFSLEDQPPVKVAGKASGSGVRGTWDPPGDMRSGSHLLVIAYADGATFTAFSGIFAVEG